MLNISKALILGIIQGITEWLPISSSGHLILTQKLLNLNVPIAFDVWLHIATLLIILVFFRIELKKILAAIFRWQIKAYEFKLAIFIAIGSIITALIVLAFKNLLEKAFTNLLPVSIALIVTGFLLFFSEKKLGQKKISYFPAILIGFMQTAAFLPGLSRSGSTISIALLLGIEKQDAFRFSFLIAIPVIIASGILKIKELVLSHISITSMITGFIVAFIIGYFSLSILKKIVIKEKFHYFAYYCWAVGILVLILKHLI